MLRKVAETPSSFEADDGSRRLYYFGYLRRDSDAPPDKDLTGYRFATKEVETSATPRACARLQGSGEFKEKRNEARMQLMARGEVVDGLAEVMWSGAK